MRGIIAGIHLLAVVAACNESSGLDSSSGEGSGCTTCDQDGGSPPPLEVDLQFEISVVGSETLGLELPADGHTRIPLLIRRIDDIESVTTPLVLSTDRQVGTFEATEVLVGSEAEVHFIPCSDESQDCLGDLTIRAMPADDLFTIVGQVDVELIEPVQIAWPAACLGDEVVVFLDGNNWVYDGTMSLTQGSFAGTSLEDRAKLYVQPSNPNQGNYWRLQFATGDTVTPLVPGVYTSTKEHLLEGGPMLNVQGDHRSCPHTGSFQIWDFEQADGYLQDLLVSFDFQCEGDANEYLQGCIRFINPDVTDSPWCEEVPPDTTTIPNASNGVEMAVVGSADLGLQLPADGRTRIPLQVTKAAPGPASIDLVFDTSRPSGRFEPASLTLGGDPETVYFTPCSNCDSDCEGPTTLTAALASAPGTPIAAVNVELVAPTRVGWPAQCLGSENILHLDGNDPILDGTMSVTAAQWLSSAAAWAGNLDLYPEDPEQGYSWLLNLRTAAQEFPLEPGVYEDATRFSTFEDGRPGLNISGGPNSVACNILEGRFEIFDFVAGDDEIVELRASFEQLCDLEPWIVHVPRKPVEVLQGCVNFSASVIADSVP